MNERTCLSFAVAALLTAAAHGGGFEDAQKLMERGQDAEAFVALAAVEGAEHLAARIARLSPDEFLPRLAKLPASVPASRVELLAGDLCLAKNDRAAAMEHYRKAAAGWPSSGYPVEPPRENAPEYIVPDLTQRAVAPFETGPGSHRDNWLIRRFIALDAADDAGREFARVWAFHRAGAEPHVRVDSYAGPPPVTNRYAVTPHGFDGQALQFAIDYAFFLKRGGDTNAALAVLMEPLLSMDMDRLPSQPEMRRLADGEVSPLPVRAGRAMPYWSRMTGGISRRDFIRLAYGEFKNVARAANLAADLEKKIAAGENRTRRVLARIRVHEGRADDAAALELAYIANGKFNDVTAAMRRGEVFEDLAQPADAAKEYEKALAMQYAALAMPDQDEASMQQAMFVQGFRFFPGADTNAAANAMRRDVLARLERLYAGLGQSDRALDAALRLFDVDDAGASNIDMLERAITRFRSAGKEAEVIALIKNRAACETNPATLANLRWVLGDTGGAAQAVASIAALKQDAYGDTLRYWKDRFRKAGAEPYRNVLKALVAARPDDAQTQLELLDAEGTSENTKAVAALEMLLGRERLPALDRFKGSRNTTQFRSFSDLAYRLMRLYERTPGCEEKLLALGFRLLEGKEKQFERKENALADYRADWNQSFHDEETVASDTLRALYVFLAHLKNPADIERASALVEKTGSIPLLNQINRLRGKARVDPATGHRFDYRAVEVRTAGVAPGARVLANRDDVRAVASGSRWGGDGEPGRAWIATSWGLVRYRERSGADRSLEILQMPLGMGAANFCDTPAGLFVATHESLCRIDDAWGDDPKIVRVAAGGAAATVLLWRDDSLWICTSGGIRRYDPRAKTSENTGGQGGRLFEGCGKLWTENSVFDPDTGGFRAIKTTEKQLRLIGATAKEIWADVWVNDQLRHRPAMLDPVTLKLTVLPITGLSRSDELQNGPFDVLGESGGGVWLRGNNPGIVVRYDREKGIARKCVEKIPPELTGSPADVAFAALAAAKLDLRGDRGPVFSSVQLPGGRVLVGASIVREWQEDNMGFDDNHGMSQHVQDLEGGLFLVDPAAHTWKKIGAPDDELSDFYVKRCVRDGDRLYLCANGGVTIVSADDGKIVGRVTVSDGLPSNKIEDVARIGDRLYFACELGDEGGGLAVQDLKTGLIQVLSRADGLKCDKIKGLRTDGKKLHILYGSFYAVRAYGTPQEQSVVAPYTAALKDWHKSDGDDSVRTFRSSILDTATGAITDGDEILPAAAPPHLVGSPMPVLGGFALVTNIACGSSTLIAGTHGALLVPAGFDAKLAAQTWPREEVEYVASSRIRQKDEARKRILKIASAADMNAALADTNPLFRARAAATMIADKNMVAACAPVLIRMLDGPDSRERSTALYLLGRLPPDESLLAAFKKRLADSDENVRGYAATLLCQNGFLPDVELLREIVRNKDEYGNYPFGLDSSVGVAVDRDRLYAALAAHAPAIIFELMLEDPPRVSDYGPDVDVLKNLAASLLKNPEAVDVLLTAHDAPHEQARVNFATTVIAYAGTNLLPRMHAALESKDRVVRSNAALACGRIGDASSIPLLIRALDLESGLSRASIVTALGRLRAAAAMPRLAQLYLDAQDEEKHRSHSGYMIAQSAATSGAHYDTIRNLDAVASDWNEIKAASLPRAGDPRRDEVLLTPRIVLEAVAQIGPSATREFYRSLAVGSDATARAEAARQLALGDDAATPETIAVLKNLLADTDESVRLAAAVSLLNFNQAVAQRSILDALEKGERWTRGAAIRELARVTERSRLAFARAAITAFIEASTGSDDRHIREQARRLLE